MNKDSKSEAAILRQKAEELLKKRPLKSGIQVSESETLKLIHELEVHQIELEMQNEEIMLSKNQAKLATEKYAELYDFASSCYFTLSEKGNIIDLNLSGSEMLGKERSHLKNRSFNFFVSNDTRPIFNHFLGKVFKSKIKETCEVNFSNNGSLPMNAHLTGIVTKNGEQCLVTVIDITNRKRTEDSLWKSENQLYSIYNTIGDVIYHLAVKAEEEYRFISVNQVFYNVTGLSKEQVIGKMVNEVIPESSLTMVLGKYRQAINENSIIRWEETSDYPTGRLIGEVSILPVFDNKGNCTHLAGSVHDITERKRAEETLKKLSNAVEQTADIVFITNRDGIIEYVNPAFEKLTGYTKQEAVGKTPRILKSGSYSQAQYEHTWKTILSGLMFKKVMINKRKSGELFYTEQTITPVKDTQGSITHFVSTNRDITERKQAEDAMRESELKFRNYIDYAPHGVFVTDEMGNYIDVNTAASSITGYSKDELLSMKLFELIPEESMEIAARHFEKVFRVGFATGESPFIKKDRSIGYWSVDAVKLSDQRFLGFVVDLTKRKQAEEMLQESKVKYQAIFESTGTATFIIAEDTTIFMANKECYSITGYIPTDLVGQKWSQYIVSENLQEMLKNHQLRSQNPDLAPKKYEVKLVNKKGEKRDVILNVGMISGTKQSVVSISDITEGKRAEKAILQSEENFHRSISESPLGIRIVSVDGKTIYANKTFLDIFEFTRLEEFTNISAINRYTHESYAQHQERKEKRKNGHDVFDYEISIIRKNAEIRHVKVSRKEVLWNGIKHYQVINIDITEQKKLTIDLIEAKEHAEQSDRLKSAFLANMSHEVRTPLNSIIGFSQLLADPDFEEEQKNEFIQSIIINGNNLLTIISDIMDISKMESGEITIRKTQINVHKFVSTLKEQFTIQANEKKLELILNCIDTDEEAMVFTDQERLQQIFNNLVGNAVKFTEKGSIEISYHLRDKFVEFQIRDTGIGIPAEFHDKIFEHFRQVESEKTRKYGGNGLGLAISKKLVELMGGEIWLGSEPYKGSVFYFTLPTYYSES